MNPNTRSATPGICLRPTLLALCISTSIGLSSSLVMAQGTPTAGTQASASTELHHFNIPAHPLGEALILFGQQSGLQVTANSSLVEGKQASPVNGSMPVNQALQLLLAGTGLHYQIRGNIISINPTGATTLPPVKVTSETITEGSAEAGYISQSVTPVGPWDGRNLQETPYSINVVPRELIENLQATSTDQVFKINPVVQMSWPQAQNDRPIIFLRGFERGNFARDGISRQPFNIAEGTAMEDVERIEVLTGLSGFLYGAGNVGGVVNFVTKRPTEEHLNSVTVGNTSGENYYIHGDFGGQFDREGRFGYRINAVTQDGDTYVDHQNLERTFFSAAFDWQVTENLNIDINASKRDYQLEGRQATWRIGGMQRPNADDINPEKNWGQKWSSQETEAERFGMNLNWHISDAISLRAGYLDESSVARNNTPINILSSENTYDQIVIAGHDAPREIEGKGMYVFSDYSFTTGTVEHQITIGFQQNESIWHIHPDDEDNIAEYTNLSLNNPTYFAMPDFPSIGQGQTYSRFDQETRTISLGDDITFNDQWSALVGISQGKINYKDYNVSGEETGSYSEDEITPTLSLIYKPHSNITTYISYMESLEQGGMAETTYEEDTLYTVINGGEVMDPLVSEQIEVGIKASIGQVLLTGALFEIDRPFEYYQVISSSQAEFFQDGRQVHRGIELTATGKLHDNLSIIGGITLLDAQIKENKQTPSLEGKTPHDVSEEMYKVYMEYTVPSVHGLTLNGGITHIGDFYGDDLNTDNIDSYTLADAGFRYVFDIGEKPVTFRFNVNNLTDEKYWANRWFIGDGRTVTLSVNTQF